MLPQYFFMILIVYTNWNFVPEIVDMWLHSPFLTSSSPKPLLEWMTPIFRNMPFINLINLLIITIKR